MSESSKPQKVVAADGHVYHKSATANASTAPTNEATITNATKQGKLTIDQLDFVTIVHYEYGLQGKLPDAQYLRNNYHYNNTELTDLFNNELVIQALEERGIEFRSKEQESVGKEVPFKKPLPKHEPKLTALQLIVANCLLDLTDTRSDKKKLADHGVSSAKYQSWLRSPDFSAYLRERAESLIGDVQHEAMLSLVDRVRGGDMNAIKYYHEITGRYVQAASSSSPGANSHDLQNIIIRIIEIVIDEVDDAQTAVRISDRLRGLITAGQVAGMLPEPPVVTDPGIAKARDITPEVQGLMSRGVGYNT